MVRENNNGKGTILLYGAGQPALECILKGNGYAVRKIQEYERLRETFEAEDNSLLLFAFEAADGQIQEKLARLAGLRLENRRPILVSMERENEELRIMALNAGADDCIGPECSVLEGFARIQAQLRCYRRLMANRRQERIIHIDGLEMDDGAKQVRVEGNRVNLTPTEYKILFLLMEKPGRVLSNRQIYERIWKMEPIGADNVVAVHIRHIREKIEENPQNPRYLRVVWGQGYKVG